MKSNILTLFACSALLIVTAGCELNQLNPNAPTDAQVLGSVEGIKALAIGMQAQYGETINETIEVSNFLTRWYFTMPASVLGLRELETGGSDVQGFNGTVNNMWSGHYRAIKSAEDLITYAPTVPLIPGTRSGIIALAKLIKGMSIGELIEAYERVPIEVTTSITPTFVDRTTALNYVITLFEEAQVEITTTPPSADFNSNVLGIGFDLTNTIRAMIARYALIKGDYDKAIAAANSVDLSKTSTLFYNSTNARNPIFLITIQLVYYKPARSWRLNAEAGDGRVAYWVSPSNQTSFHGKPVDDFNQFKTDAAKYYVYLPGEIMLIKAEAYARKNDLVNALTEVNRVRTKTAASDPAGIGAGLPPKTAAQLSTQAAMLEEIFRQRQYELFITGLLLGDSRRFGKPNSDRTRNWLPYPDTERLSNPNTPPDPAF
jgi:hypothetical protein